MFLGGYAAVFAGGARCSLGRFVTDEEICAVRSTGVCCASGCRDAGIKFAAIGAIFDRYSTIRITLKEMVEVTAVIAQALLHIAGSACRVAAGRAWGFNTCTGIIAFDERIADANIGFAAHL